MKEFLTENKTIIFGLSMPIIFITIFGLYSFISSSLTSDPKYNILYSTSNYNSNFDISVINNHVKVTIFEKENINNTNHITNKNPNNISLWFFNSETKETKEIYLDISEIIKEEKLSKNKKNISYIYNVDIPELNNIQVYKSDISPDGYKINNKNVRNEQLLSGLFQNYSRNNKIFLFKNYKTITIKEENYYDNKNFKFIGWTESSL